MHIVCPHCLTTNRVPPERARDAPICGRCQEPLLPAHPIELDDTHFERLVLGSQLPVLIDFWAPWCGPCRSFAPHFEAVARELQGSVVCAKVNSDDNPKTSVRYRIRSIPTLLLLSGDKELGRVSGAMPANELKRWLQPLLPARTA